MQRHWNVINRNNPQILPCRETDAGAELKLKCKLEWPNSVLVRIIIDSEDRRYHEALASDSAGAPGTPAC